MPEVIDEATSTIYLGRKAYHEREGSKVVQVYLVDTGIGGRDRYSCTLQVAITETFQGVAALALEYAAGKLGRENIEVAGMN